MAGLSVQQHSDGEGIVLAVTGELDLGSADILRESVTHALADGAWPLVQLDLAGLTFIDSSGLGLLVELRRAATEHQSSLQLINVPPGPARILSIAGLAEIFGLPAGSPQAESPEAEPPSAEPNQAES